MTGPAVTAFRMGGDEFCVVANVPQGGALAIAERAAQALSESGTGYSIRCSFGLALYPSEAGDGIEALGIADERLYEHKDARALSGDRIPEPVRMR
jgi:GGDEF domain-containing protein